LVVKPTLPGWSGSESSVIVNCATPVSSLTVISEMLAAGGHIDHGAIRVAEQEIADKSPPGLILVAEGEAVGGLGPDLR
jgi:hypothetical protein